MKDEINFNFIFTFYLSGVFKWLNHGCTWGNNHKYVLELSINHLLRGGNFMMASTNQYLLMGVFWHVSGRDVKSFKDSNLGGGNIIVPLSLA